MVGTPSLRESDLDYDVTVIGGGPAGLSAALQLGRSRRSVLVCDNNEPRNGPAAEAHGYLTRDGIAPDAFRRLGREELRRYGVEFRDELVADVERHTDRFTVSFGSGERYETRKVVLATGVVDVLPDIDGFEERWGRGVYHCPYCHGYEVRDQPLGVHVDMAPKLEYAKLIYNLSDDLVVFTDGNDVFDSDTEAAFVERGVRIEREAIVAVGGVDGTLESITLADGRTVARDALFYGPLMRQRTVLVDRLGLDTDEFGFVDVTRSEPPMGGAGRTSVEGVFVAGDASNGSSPSIVTAAAEGYEVGATINAELSDELF